MKYISTRDKSTSVSAAEAISLGLSREGGLFLPDSVPALTKADIEEIARLSYPERAKLIMSRYLEDYTEEELGSFCSKAYGENFDCPECAPTVKVGDKTHVLELWHGPTSAFKDMALQMLPYLLTAAMKKTGETKKVCILVATSGDTGKAALEGFKDVENTKIMVFYPSDGVSDVQKLQMQSQEGENVGVIAITGNFDDAQSAVKTIFSDEKLREELDSKGWFLSSANSINWGRLLPQIVYYVSSYADLVASGEIGNGEEVDFCVPTGNFGDILAGYFAKLMGLPVGRLICASNANNVLTDFINTGVYDRNRRFYTTISPSMDILISSNLERLLYLLSGDDKLVARLMAELKESGKYTAPAELMEKLRASFAAEFLDDAETKEVIGRVWREKGYLMDTHTAVAYGALEKYRKADPGRTCVVLSTASPFKFTPAVLEAIGEDGEGAGVELIDRLSSATGKTAPKNLAALKTKKARFSKIVEKTELLGEVKDFLR
ncbi:MAG: threonine synthase [Oscillospiraceae bacterium]|nr:threonine synthase [Oscillospiraceae bacterium]